MTPRLSPRTNARWLPWATGVLTLMPLFWCWSEFRALFWFGDEWDQLDAISGRGFWSWVWNCFGENFAPLFKITWGGLALAGHGSYFVAVATVWLLHGVCAGLLCRWMLRCGGSAIASVGLCLVFGVATTSIEVLGWTVQLITIQGMLFFLLAAELHESRQARGDWSIESMALLLLWIVGSTFSFVRGPLTGATLAVTTIVFASPTRSRGSQFAVAATCFVPALVAVAIELNYAPGNHQHLGAIGLRAPAMYGASYFLLNPFYKFATDTLWTMRGLMAWGALKLTLLVSGWCIATARQRRMLLPLFLFDFGNAILMGLGRYNEPLYTATSSRYQYISLLCTVPFIAVLLDASLARLSSLRWRRAAAAVAVVALATVAARRWPAEMRGWANARGTATRVVLFATPNPPVEGAIPGIPFLRTSRAKELVQQYHLH